MFIKLVLSGGTNGDTQEATVTAIRNLLDGTWTSVDNLPGGQFDKANCEVIGSTPLCNDGVTPTYQYYSSSFTDTTTSDARIGFYWRHPDYSSSYQITGFFYLYFSTASTYGIRTRAGISPSYILPYNSTSYYNNNGTDANRKYHFQANNETILIWANKHNFVYHQYNNGYALTTGLMSHESTPANEYTYSLTTTPSPFIGIGSFFGGNGAFSRLGAASSWNTTYDYFWIGSGYYTSKDGNAVTSPVDASWNLGYNASPTANYMSLSPKPYKNVWSMPAATGYTHQVIPVRLDPHLNYAYNSYPYNGTLNAFYRTTDDIAPSGTQITIGSDTYRVLMMHKCGANWGDTQAIENACYLIPELVDGR